MNYTKLKTIYRPYLIGLCQLIAPICPHLGEEIYQGLGFDGGISFAPWPTFEEKHLLKDTVNIAVQINGKLRATLVAKRDLDAKTLEVMALESDGVKRNLEGKTVKKVIVVANRIVNIVAV